VTLSIFLAYEPNTNKLGIPSYKKKRKRQKQTKKASLDYKPVKPSKVKELEIFVLQLHRNNSNVTS